MHQLIDAIKAWPVIVQGALGSALFWLVLLVGQKLADASASHLASRNTARRKTQIFNRLLRLRALRAGHNPADVQSTYYLAAHLFRMARPLLMGLVWLTLGFIFDSLIGVFGTVGYVGCLYYLFSALSVIRHTPPPADIDGAIKALEKEFGELEEKIK